MKGIVGYNNLNPRVRRPKGFWSYAAGGGVMVGVI